MSFITWDVPPREAGCPEHQGQVVKWLTTTKQGLLPFQIAQMVYKWGLPDHLLAGMILEVWWTFFSNPTMSLFTKETYFQSLLHASSVG